MIFSLKDVECWVNLGVPDWERESRQKILISIDFTADTQKAEKSDDIKDTVDYFQIYRAVKSISQDKSYHLLESLHKDLIDYIQKKFTKISDIKIQIQKFPFSDASIMIKNR